MDSPVLLGLIAGLLTTVGFLPQIIKGLRSRSMEDVSLLMPALVGVGMLLWLIYGIWLDSLPIVLWNAVGFSLNMIILVLAWRYRGCNCED